MFVQSFVGFSPKGVYSVSLISGSVTEEIEKIVENPNEVIKLLAGSLPGQGAFFMELLIITTCVGSMIELFRVVPLFQAFVRRFFCGSRLTVQEKRRAVGMFKPVCVVDKFYYSRSQARFLLYFMVMFVYSSITPLVNWMSLIFFLWLGSVYRYQFVFNYPSSPDSGGTIWLHFIRVLLAVMVIGQLALTGFLALQRAGAASATMIPLIVATVVFISYLEQRHWKLGEYLPSRVALNRDLENYEEECDYEVFLDSYKNPTLMHPDVQPNWNSGKEDPLSLSTPTDNEKVDS